MQIFDRTMSLLGQALDLRAARHRVIASNLANEETPGYRAKEFEFLDLLAAAAREGPKAPLSATDAEHFRGLGHGGVRVTGRVVEVPAADMPLDENSVSLEIEMAKLADNAMQYNTAATIMAIRFRQLLAAIREAR